MQKFIKFIGLDVHAKTIAVSIVNAGRGKARFLGTIENTPAAIEKLLKQVNPDGELISVCYEAGPCGFGLHRQITAMGHDCQVIAPSLIPKRSADRIKTDRRDSLRLAELHRAGELSAIRVPDCTQEAMRDLVRARGDFKKMQLEARQRLNAFLLRHGWRWDPNKSRWTLTHWRWLEKIKMPHSAQQYTLARYMELVREFDEHLKEIEAQMLIEKEGWELKPIVDGLVAMRGVRLVTAMGVVAELGDMSQFASARQVMAFLGLIPSEHSSGEGRRQGAITKTGNGHVRRLLVEAAWCHRFQARRSGEIAKRAKRATPGAQAIAWKAQKRLCGRYRRLTERGLAKNKVTTAVARELSGFMWATPPAASRALSPT